MAQLLINAMQLEKLHF